MLLSLSKMFSRLMHAAADLSILSLSWLNNISLYVHIIICLSISGYLGSFYIFCYSEMVLLWTFVYMFFWTSVFNRPMSRIAGSNGHFMFTFGGITQSFTSAPASIYISNILPSTVAVSCYVYFVRLPISLWLHEGFYFVLFVVIAMTVNVVSLF